MRRNNRVSARPYPKQFRSGRLRVILIAAGVLLMGCAVASRWPHSREIGLATPSAPVAPPGVLAFILPAGNGRSELRGDANIGGWVSKSTDIHATVMFQMSPSTLETLFNALASGAPLDSPRFPIPVEPPGAMKLVVPVTSFKGGHIGMDHDMQAALKAPLYPDIVYVLKSVQGVRAKPATPGGQPAFEVQVLGELSVGGVRRTTTTNAAVYRDPTGHIIVHAEQDMLMSDFGVKPPSGLFGLIRAGNSMSVIFDLDFIPETFSGTASAMSNGR